ncbi:MAG: adenosine kinase [Spirochaetales bacterium]|nr:adenosine kinase [Spirochaetales bacterium]
MDFVINADNNFITELGAEKGTMQLISAQEKDRILSLIHDYRNIPGGSCANTLRGIAWLSKYDRIDQTIYSGAVGKDDVGNQYISMMKNDFGIDPLIPQKEKATGLCIAVVTPDYERTMFTYLGACEDFSEVDVNTTRLKESSILHFTGYMWGTENEKKAIEKASKFCRENKITISFDLADPLMVKFHYDEFIEMIPRYVDILFGNKEEISMITGIKGADADIACAAGKLAPLVIMKTGAEGCIVNDKGNIIIVKGIKVDAIDTVGAGDSFASGFLYGQIKKMSPEKCATIANRLAAGIVSVEGCDFSRLNQVDILGA